MSVCPSEIHRGNVPLGLESALQCAAPRCAGNHGRKLENMCSEKTFTLTLLLAGNPVGKTPSCLCVQIPGAGAAGGAGVDAAQLPRCSCGKEMKLSHND